MCLCENHNNGSSCACTYTVMSFLSIAFIAHISPVLVQSVLEHVHRRSLYYCTCWGRLFHSLCFLRSSLVRCFAIFKLWPLVWYPVEERWKNCSLANFSLLVIILKFWYVPLCLWYQLADSYRQPLEIQTVSRSPLFTMSARHFHDHHS